MTSMKAINSLMADNWARVAVRWLWVEVVILTLSVFVLIGVNIVRPENSMILYSVIGVFGAGPLLAWIILLLYFGIRLQRSLRNDFDFSSTRKRLIHKTSITMMALLGGIVVDLCAIVFLGGAFVQSGHVVVISLFVDFIVQPTALFVMYFSVLYFLHVNVTEIHVSAGPGEVEFIEDQNLRSTSYRIMEDVEDDQ